MKRSVSRLAASCLVLMLGCSKESQSDRGGPRSGGDDPVGGGTGGSSSLDIPNAGAMDGSVPVFQEPPVPSGIEGSIDPDCTGDCMQTIIGEGSAAFDLSSPDTSSVGLDADGALIVAPGESVATGPSFIWIANTEGRGCDGKYVSKVDTDSLVEVGRYEVGFCDPSRTSVNIAGDVFVASRYGNGVTKVMAAGQDCPDTNGDGVITTSTGPNDVYPLGQDDCVAWWTQLPAGDVRGIAAQDVGGEVIVEPQLDDAPPVVTVIPPKSYVWASGAEHDTLYKLDGDTGAILFETPSPARAYGAALDGNGLLWMTGGALGGANLGFVDTNQCVDAQSCAAATCTTTCDANSCPGNCDGAVKGHLTLPGGKYGITVDCKQRVWMAGFTTNVQRYDHYAPAGARFGEAASAGGHGITADGLGRVWVGNVFFNTVSRIDGDTLAVHDLSVPAPKGMAVDGAGKVWVVRGAGIDGGNAAHIIEPGPGMMDNNITLDAVSGFLAAYTYSDMTGQQLRLASREPSVYVQTIEACGGADTDWRNLTWDVEIPAGAWIVFRARVGVDKAAAEQAEWLTVATLPGSGDQSAIKPFLDSAMQGGPVMQIEISMASADGNLSNDNGCGEMAGTTPRVLSFGASYDCNVVVE